MASIENRSRFIVTVQNREDLAQTFACTRDKELKRYIAKLKADGYRHLAHPSCQESDGRHHAPKVF